MGLEKDYHLYVKMHDLHFNDNTVTKARFKMLCCAVIMSNFRSSNRKPFNKTGFAFIPSKIWVGLPPSHFSDGPVLPPLTYGQCRKLLRFINSKT